MSDLLSPSDPALLGDLRQLIDGARTRAAQAVNAEITLLYWQVGKRIRTDILKHERAGYGLEIVSALSRQLTAAYGKGWGSRQLHHCLRFAETIPQLEIVNALRTQLTWTHLRQVIGIDDSLKRDFYLEMCRLEKWSTRQLQERIDSMLYERTALSKQPEETIRHDLALLRDSGIHVAEYLTVLPPRKLLAERLHRSIEAARARLPKAQEDAL